jgi:hypothetical protein
MKLHWPKSAAVICGVVAWRPAKLVGANRQTNHPTKINNANHLQTRAGRGKFMVVS